MPPRRFSRFALSAAVPSSVDATKLVLTDREPFRFRALPDSRQHIVVEGDTLWTLAAKYFPGFFPADSLRSPAELFWVIADFQPDPIHDPTLDLDPGRLIVVPSERTVREEIFSEKRRVD